MGAFPTHPELLDWLDYGSWSTGILQERLHTNPRNERHVSPVVPRMTLMRPSDGDNRFLWRRTAARLDAECIGHHAFISGRLTCGWDGGCQRTVSFSSRTPTRTSPFLRLHRFGMWIARKLAAESSTGPLFGASPDPVDDAWIRRPNRKLVARRLPTQP